MSCWYKRPHKRRGFKYQRSKIKTVYLKFGLVRHGIQLTGICRLISLSQDCIQKLFVYTMAQVLLQNTTGIHTDIAIYTIVDCFFKLMLHSKQSTFLLSFFRCSVL